MLTYQQAAQISTWAGVVVVVVVVVVVSMMMLLLVGVG